MSSPFATTIADQGGTGLVMGTFLHDILPCFALAAGLMAAIWLACAVIVIVGYLIGGLIFLGVRELVHACVRRVRHRRSTEYARLVTVDADGAHTKVVHLDRYRRRHPHKRHQDGLRLDNTSQRHSDDDPA